MTVKSSRAALLVSLETDTSKDNSTKYISPAKNRQSFMDTYDTLMTSNNIVADISTLNSLMLGPDFKEGDIFFVTNISKGDKVGIYAYLRDRSSGLYSWVELAPKGEVTKLVNSTQATIANYISIDFTSGDLAIGYLVKLTTGQIYMLVSGTGSSSGDYQLIVDRSNINRAEVDTISLRDNLVLGTDFNVGDYITVTDDGNGQKVKYKYIYDDNISDYKWEEIGLLSNVSFG